MKFILFIISLLFLSILKINAQCTYTLRPSTDGKDTYVFSHPQTTSYAQATGRCDTSNFGSDPIMAVADWTFMSTPGTERAYLEFDLANIMSLGCFAQSATLVLPHSGDASNYNCGIGSSMVTCLNNSIVMSRVTQAWDENTITWQNQPPVANAINGSDYMVLPDESGYYASYTIDLTQIVNGWLSSTNPNYGLRFQFLNEFQQYKRVSWGTSENSDSTKRPYLIITLGSCASCNNVIEGTVFNDANNNCIKESGDVGLNNWIVKATPGPFYANTDASGKYKMHVPPGNYTIQQLIPNTNLWDAICPAPYNYSTTINPGDSISNLNFGVHASVVCPQLWVDIGADRLRPCHEEAYYVNYCNNGNDTANNVTIDLTLDTALTFNSSSITLASQTGNVFTFNIGALIPGQCGQFNFSAIVSCSSQIGQTKCVEAAIKPLFTCTQPISTSWDHSSVSVDGVCNDSLACFTITNTGSAGGGDMQGTSEYRIYENGILVYTGTFQLTGGDNLVVCWPANGNTIQLQADQRPFHPGYSHPNAYVEDCGSPNDTSTVYGIINTTAPDDENADIEIDCQQIVMSWDPNDKTVIPTGVGSEHYINNYDELEYKIRFQNTGNDTAFNIVIRDTLSSYLDPSTVISGVSSHNYSFQLFGNGILQWTFANILLPDSTTNEPLSHGFVKFKIKQTPGNISGNQIKNRVGIIFDINDPVLTNTTLNTIWINNPVQLEKNQIVSDYVKVYPNPSEGIINFELSSKNISTWNLSVMDALGRVVSSEKIIGKANTSCDLRNMPKGIYFYKITSDNANISVGKIIIF